MKRTHAAPASISFALVAAWLAVGGFAFLALPGTGLAQDNPDMRVTRIAVNPDTVRVRVGERVRVEITAVDEDGNPVQGADLLAYSNGAEASFDPVASEVVGISPGETTVGGRIRRPVPEGPGFQTLRASVTVIVLPRPVERIEIVDAPPQLYVGTRTRLQAQAHSAARARDDAMIDISRHRPASLDALGKIRGLSEGLVRNSGNKIVELVREATGKTPLPFPDKGKHTKLSIDQNALVDVMMALLRLSGEQNNLNPAVLATRKQLEMLVLGDQDAAVLHGWRKQLVGKQLLEFLNGELRLSVSDSRLAIEQ